MTRTAKYVLTLTIGLLAVGISSVAFAQGADATQAAVDVAKAGNGGWIALAAGLGLAIAAFGGALGQGRAAATALEGIARNPGAADKLFMPMILGLVFIESLVIYALIFGFVLLGKI